MFPSWAYGVGWILWLLVPLLTVGLTKMSASNGNISKEDYEADARRREGGTYYTEMVWELLGRADKDIEHVTALIVEEADSDKRSKLANLLASRNQDKDAYHRMLRYKREGTGDD